MTVSATRAGVAQQPAGPPLQDIPVVVPPAALQSAQRDGTARVIVRLDVPAQPEGQLGPGLVAVQRQAIGAAQAQVIQRLGGVNARPVRLFETIPYLAMEVSADALNTLAQTPGVIAIEEDRLVEPTLIDSVPIIQGPQAWSAGYDGSGWAVAVLDTGVESSHSFLAGKVVSEACYAANATCPNGTSTQIGPGAGAPCTYAPSACQHGTHVAGIAAGSGATSSGAARGADIVAIQVFTRFTTGCAGENPCALATTGDIIAGLERVYALRTSFQIAAVNMSLGGGGHTDQSSCDAQSTATKAVIDNLRSASIATVIASGNSGFTNMIGWPGCISSAVSVGSTTKQNAVSPFSNAAPFLSLLAPGGSINSSIPGNAFGLKSGTSMAAPHVAGAWAIVKQRAPSASVTTVLNAFQATGVSITDTRNGLVKPLIQVASALNQFSDLTLSVNDVRTLEGNSGTRNATFTVSLSGVSSGPVAAAYRATAFTADGDDFVPVSGTVTIPGGSLTQTIDVPIVGDTFFESSETVVLTLSDPVGANLGDGQGIATIVNDDFTDSSLTGIPMKTVHVTELRAAIDEARAAKGLAAFPFTDSALTPQFSVIRAAHLIELRTAVTQAYTAAGLPPPAFTDGTLIAGVTPIKAVHILEIRAAVVNLP